MNLNLNLLERISQGHIVFCHGPEAVGSNPGGSHLECIAVSRNKIVILEVSSHPINFSSFSLMFVLS